MPLLCQCSQDGLILEIIFSIKQVQLKEIPTIFGTSKKLKPLDEPLFIDQISYFSI